MDSVIREATGSRSALFRFSEIREKLLAEVRYDWNAYDGALDGLSASGQIEKAVAEASYTD